MFNIQWKTAILVLVSSALLYIVGQFIFLYEGPIDEGADFLDAAGKTEQNGRQGQDSMQEFENDGMPQKSDLFSQTDDIDYSQGIIKSFTIS